MEINPEIVMINIMVVIFIFIGYCGMRIAGIRREYLLKLMLKPEEFVKDLKIFFYSLLLTILFITIEILASIFISFEFPFWVMVLYTPIALLAAILIAWVFGRWYIRLRW